MDVIGVDTIQEGDKLRWSFPDQATVHSGVVIKIRGYGHSKYYGAPYLDAFMAYENTGGATYHSIAFPLITHRNGRRVDRSSWDIVRDTEDYTAQIVLPLNRKDAELASLTTKTRKSLDDMSESHRAHIEKWEPHIEKMGGEHVWASVKRFPGRGGDGPMYVALKRGSKDYAIVDYDTERMVKPKVLADGFESSTQVMEAFKEYRAMAKEERAEAKAAEKPAKKASTKKATTTKAKAPAAKKPAAKKPAAKKPTRKVKK